MTLHKAHFATALGAVLLLSLPASAFNGAMARALPIENITIDGDLSDWPPDAERWPIARTVSGEAPRDSVDFHGFFHIGYHAEENALFAEVAEQSPSAICEHLALGGEQWADGRPRDDDVTFVVIKVGR